MSATAVTLFAISLVLGAVVVAAVAVLLRAVLAEALAVEAGARQIWVTGKLVARNTVHIPALARTNQIVADIGEGAAIVLLNAQRILAHAQHCPGCPACLGGQRT